MPLRKEEMSKGQLIMLDDGAHPGVFLSSEERKNAWIKNPPVPPRGTGTNRQPDLTDKGKDDMIARRTNTNPVLPIHEMDFANMGIEELKWAHNKMAEKLGHPAVANFQTAAEGERECHKLAARLKPEEVKSTPEAEASNTKETNVAKKAAKKAKGAKKAKAPAKVKAVVVDNRSAILKEFDARAGTNRAKMIEALAEAGNKGLKQGALLKKVYGSANTDNAGAMDMVWKGVPDMIKKQKLGSKYEALREGRGEESNYSLKKK